MVLDKKSTPLPPQSFAPALFTVADWFDLPANDRVGLLKHSQFRDQAVDVRGLGGRPETGVALEVQATANTERGGTSTAREDVETEALDSLADPIQANYVATDRLELSVRNRSATDHTQASGTPYQAYMSYQVRSLTVLDKILRGIPLTEPERELGEKFDLFRRKQLGALPSVASDVQPNLENKTIVDEDTDTFVVDTEANDTPTSLTDVRVENDEVVYLTGLSINGDTFTAADDLRFIATRSETDDILSLETFAVPGLDYDVPLFVPFLDRMTLSLESANALTGVEVQVRYATARRTLREKALYGLENEVKSNDNYRDTRFEVYNELRDRILAGVELAPALNSLPADPSTPTSPGNVASGRRR